MELAADSRLARSAGALNAELAKRFDAYRCLTVRQRVRWFEVLLSFEQGNQYVVYDQHGAPVLHVRELTSDLLALVRRLLLGPIRPFVALVSDVATLEPVLRLRRPFRFFFSRLEVQDAGGYSIGAIQRRWSWLRRLYDVEDEAGRVVATLFGPLLRPWTFEIVIAGEARGRIHKRWSGLGRELFTDADNFGVDLELVTDTRLRALSFAATVLIDVVHFERAK